MLFLLFGFTNVAELTKTIHSYNFVTPAEKETDRIHAALSLQVGHKLSLFVVFKTLSKIVKRNSEILSEQYFPIKRVVLKFNNSFFQAHTQLSV